MKKLALLIFVFAYAQVVSAQGGFFFTPEFGFGVTSIKITSEKRLKLTEEQKVCSNVNFGFTIGKTEQKERYRYFVGGLLERNGYGFKSICQNDHEDINVGTGSWKFGVRMLFKQNSGLVYGGTISFNVWDDIHTVVERVHEDNCDNWYYNPDNAFSAGGHVGYSWNHFMLLLNIGYESGIKSCITAAFPIYFVE